MRCRSKASHSRSSLKGDAAQASPLLERALALHGDSTAEPFERADVQRTLGAGTGHDRRRRDGMGCHLPLDVRGSSGSQTATLACFRWNGMQEEVFTLDPMTGTDTLLGTVGDLHWWEGATAVDPLAERLYAVGDNDTGYFLYVLDSTTGALLMSLPIAGAVSGLQVAPDGSLLHARWNGMSEDLVRLDPATGVETVIGTVGDLQWWSGETAIDTVSAVYYAIGNDGSNDELWALDAGSGALLSEMVLPGAIGSGLQLTHSCVGAAAPAGSWA